MERKVTHCLLLSCGRWWDIASFEIHDKGEHLQIKNFTFEKSEIASNQKLADYISSKYENRSIDIILCDTFLFAAEIVVSWVIDKWHHKPVIHKFRVTRHTLQELREQDQNWCKQVIQHFAEYHYRNKNDCDGSPDSHFGIV